MNKWMFFIGLVLLGMSCSEDETDKRPTGIGYDSWIFVVMGEMQTFKLSVVDGMKVTHYLYGPLEEDEILLTPRMRDSIFANGIVRPMAEFCTVEEEAVTHPHYDKIITYSWLPTEELVEANKYYYWFMIPEIDNDVYNPDEIRIWFKVLSPKEDESTGEDAGQPAA